MKTIYLDSDFKCHIFDDGTMTSVETDFFIIWYESLQEP